MVKKFFGYFIVTCVVVAVWNTFSHDPATFRAQLSSRSAQFQAWTKKVTASVEGALGTGTSGKDGGHDTNTPTKPAPKPSGPATPGPVGAPTAAPVPVPAGR